jgi:GNAT superfamily N-acetyltransferase
MRRRTAGNFAVRPATRADIPDVVKMITALRAEQGSPAPRLERRRLARDVFSPPEKIVIVVAEAEGRTAGYAMFQKFYEPVAGLEGLHLADIYVRPEFRRAGIATELMERVRAEALGRHLHFVWWVADAASASASAFYARLGARSAATVSYSWPLSP